MTQTPSIGDMVNQSRQVLSKPSVATFEQYENSGTLQQALIYVAIAAAITGIFGIFGGLGAFLSGIISTLVGFLVFTYLVYFIGKQQGGTGSYDQVAYTFSLFWAPLAVIFGIVTLVLTITIIGIFLVPLVAIAALIANVYFGYLAVQSSMNVEAGGKAWLILILAAIGSFVVSLIVGAILGIGR
jgi:hypothetical protein